MYFLGSMFNIMFRIALLVVLLGGISVPGEFEQPQASTNANSNSA